MTNLEYIKNLSRLTSIYTLGKILPAILGFALYPVFTRYLSPAEFGIIGLAILVGSGAKPLFSLGTDAAAFNFYHRYDGSDREEFYTTLALFISVVSVGWILVFEVFGAELFRLLLGEDIYDPYLRIVLLSIALTVSFQLVPKQRFKASEQAKWLVSMDLGQSVVNQGVSLFAVIILSLGAVGYLYGSLLSSVATGVVGLVFLLRWSIPTVSMEKLRTALVYSIPMFPHLYSHFVISMADRLLLAHLGSLTAVGVYTIGYTLASAIPMVIRSAGNAIMPEFARASDDGEAFERLSPTATYFLLFAAVVTIGFSLFMPLFVRLLFPADYQSAIDVLPWLALAFFSIGLYYVPMGVLGHTQRNTKPVPILTFTAAVVNVGLNYVLIPRFGIVGAAVSTLAAYVLLATMVFLVSQRAEPVAYQYRRVGLLTGSMVTVIVLGMWLPMFGFGVDLVARISSFLSFFALLTVLGFWEEEEKAITKELLYRVLALLR